MTAHNSALALALLLTTALAAPAPSQDFVTASDPEMEVLCDAFNKVTAWVADLRSRASTLPTAQERKEAGQILKLAEKRKERMMEMKWRTVNGPGENADPPVVKSDPDYSANYKKARGTGDEATACTSPPPVERATDLAANDSCKEYREGIQPGETTTVNKSDLDPSGNPLFDYDLAAVILSHEAARLDQSLIAYASTRTVMDANAKANPPRRPWIGMPQATQKEWMATMANNTAILVADADFFRYLRDQHPPPTVSDPGIQWTSNHTYRVSLLEEAKITWGLVLEVQPLTGCPIPTLPVTAPQ